MLMKRLYATLAGVTLIAGLSVGQMSDVPQSHWAYEAIEELVRLGVIEGYPDGTYQPRRAMTRAEFAQALARALRRVTTRMDELSNRIRDLENRPSGGGGGGGTDQGLADRVKALEDAKAEMDNMKRALETIQRAAANLPGEMANMSADIENLKREVAAAKARLDALEGKRDKVTLKGDLTFGVIGTHSIDGLYPMTMEGNFINATGELLSSFEVLHEMGLGVDVKINDDVTGHGTFLLGNALPYYGGATKNVAMYGGMNPGSSNTDVTIWEAYVKAPIGLLGNNFNLTVGRFPAKLTPYTLMRIDPGYYTGFARYEDGAYRVDGVHGAFDFGNVQLALWAARTSTVRSNNNLNFSNLMFNNHNTMGAAADQFAGARLDIGLMKSEEEDGNMLNLGATYYAAGVPAGTPLGAPGAGSYNRVDVMGADLKGRFAGFDVGVEYAQTNFFTGDNKNALNKDNWVLDGSLGYEIGENIDLKVGYREIRPRFQAPGSWGRLGFLFNPSDLKGFYAKAGLKVGGGIDVKIGGSFYEGTGRLANGVGYQTSDKVNRLMGSLDYQLSERWNISLGYEGVFWRPRSAVFGSPSTNPVWNYYTVGLGYDLGENASLNVMYQVLDYDGKGVAALSGGSSATKNRGGVASTTLSVKF